MFRCDDCGKVVPPGIKSQEVVTKRRARTYPFRHEVNRMATWKEEKADRMASMNDAGGKGWEAAEVRKICPQCHKKRTEDKD